MYRRSCIIDSFKLNVYLSALPQTPQEKKKKQPPVLLSICSSHEIYLVLASSSKGFFLCYTNRVTVVFWNAVLTGIPLLAHSAPWMRLERKTEKNSHLNSSILWGQLCALYIALYIFCPRSSFLVEQTKCQTNDFLFLDASEATRALAESHPKVQRWI